MNRGYRLIYAASVRVVHDEVSTGRPKGQWVYFQARNRCWIAVKNLPRRYALSTTLLWWAYTAWVGLTHGQFSFFLRGVRDSLLGLPEILRARQPLRKPVVAEMKRLSGRVWY